MNPEWQWKFEGQLKVRQVDQMMDVLKKLPDHFAVYYEAGSGYGHYHELLTPIAMRVAVANPGLFKLIYRSKINDRRDAELLAKLLSIDQVPAVHVPSADVRAWRELIDFRQKLVQKRTRAKNEGTSRSFLIEETQISCLLLFQQAASAIQDF